MKIINSELIIALIICALFKVTFKEYLIITVIAISFDIIANYIVEKQWKIGHACKDCNNCKDCFYYSECRNKNKKKR